MKAIAGLWPYGSGDIVHPAGSRMFFAGQDPDLPTRLTLKELICYPDFGGKFTDIQIAAALAEHHHNVSRAAKALGLSRGALYRRMERHGL